MKAVTEGRGGEAGANVIRDTPGRLLMAWALLFSSLVLLSWRVHVHRAEYDWLEYPTALGDRSYYGTGEGGGLGANDFFEANLKFEMDGNEVALFRRLHEPTRRRDVSMRKVAREESGRFYVYTDGASEQQDGPRFYLKAGEDRYVAFGERIFYPTYEETLKK
jgi:hypothetical protein